jgi:transcriptional regulator with XRE-family HTH domain
VGDSGSAVKASALAKFADQLRAWRKSRDWSQVVLAGKLLCSDSLVSGVETADKTPTLEFAIRCDEAFGTPGTFVALHELISREAWPSYFAPVIDFEARAIRIHEWELRVIPGLLQTESYARSVISSGKPRQSADALDRAVSGRIERQRIRRVTWAGGRLGDNPQPDSRDIPTAAGVDESANADQDRDG